MVVQLHCLASKRQTCRVVGQRRSTQRHPAKGDSIEEENLRHRLCEIGAEQIRWGERRLYRLIRRKARA